MKLKFSNKKMANLGLIIVLVCTIGAALGAFIWNKYSSKANSEKHMEVLNQGKEIKNGVTELKEQTTEGLNAVNEHTSKSVDEIKDHMTKGIIDVEAEIKKKEIILISPDKILIPANSSREVPVVITNNHDYPVFFVYLELEVTNGELDLSTNFMLIPLYGGGIWQPKSFSCAIPQINAKTAVNLLVKIDGEKYSQSSKIKLSVSSYMKEPAPNFSKGNMKEFPQTIKVPDGFIPQVFPNK